jgi:hypothetical protein
MKLELNLSIADAIHLQTVVLFKAKDHIKSYKLFSGKPKIAKIFRESALQEFKMYKQIREQVHP